METPPTPSSERVDSYAGMNDAIDRLLGMAQRRIEIFDVDLHDARWGGPARHDVLKRFLLASPRHQLHIVLHDTTHTERAHARLTNLLRSFSDRMEIRRTFGEAKQASDPFVLIDQQHYLRQLHYAQMRSEFGLDQPEAGKQLALRFKELWESSEPSITATVLGL